MKLVIALSLIAAPAFAQSVAPAVRSALADPARPAADRERDAARHAGEIIAFAGVKPGDKVADFIMGGGYWTRLLAGVVGPKGRVYAYQPAEFIQFKASYGTDQDAAVAGRANVVPTRVSLGAIAFAQPLDAIVTVQNWHDLHLKQMPAGLAALVAGRLYAALKPGGTLLVIDHVGAPGTQDTLHRGDPAATRIELEKAGFRLEAQSPLLAAPNDPHTASVFDPAIRGKTDQFVYRFRKPR